MTDSRIAPFTVVLETREPFGPEIQVLRIEAEDARNAAIQALCDWHSIDCDETTTVADLEDGSAHVLAVFATHVEAALTRNPAQQLV